MRTTRPLVAVALVLSLAGCGRDKEEVLPATVVISSPVSGSTLEGNVVDLVVNATGVTVKAADGDTTGTTGHFHAFVDKEPVAAGEVIPREAGVIHFATGTLRIPGLSVGEHTIKVILGDGAHRRIGSALATLSVTTSGPSLDASAPPNVAVGAAVPVTIKPEGYTVAKADGDVSGKTGHFHLFVDREPVAGGALIPKEDGIIHSADLVVSVPGLKAGEHTIWVVAGDGAHRAFAPLVADKVTVTVA